MKKVPGRAHNRAMGGSPWSVLAAVLLALAFTSPAAPQAQIRGLVETIEDDQRHPVHEAAIRAFANDEAIAVSFTDREGRYTLEVPAESFELRLVKPGYVVARAGGLERPTVHRSCPKPGDCGAIDFLLERAAALEVRLTDPSGDPFPGARVQLTPAGADDDASRHGETDDRGVERFYGLTPGAYRLDFHLLGSIPTAGPLFEIDSTQLELRAGENTPMHLSARRAGSETFSLSGLIEGVKFAGRIYDLVVRPIAGRLDDGISLRQDSPEVSIPRLQRGEYVLQLVPRGAPSESQSVLLGRFRIDENLAGLTLRPSQPGTLTGHARFEEGAPDHANLVLRSDEGWTWRIIHVEKQFPNFKVSAAPPGVYTLAAEGQDFFLVDPPAFHLAEGADRAVQITLSARFARVAGVVRDAGEAAVRVELSGPRGPVVATPGLNGAFAFEKLIPGEYSLCAALTEEACPRERVRRFAVEAGDDIEVDLGAPR